VRCPSGNVPPQSEKAHHYEDFKQNRPPMAADKGVEKINHIVRRHTIPCVLHDEFIVMQLSCLNVNNGAGSHAAMYGIAKR